MLDGWRRGTNSSEQFMSLMALTSIGFTFIAAIYGCLLGVHPDHWITAHARRESHRPGRPDALGSFIATVPLSDRAMAQTNLIVCGGAIGLAAIAWVLCGGLLWLTWHPNIPLHFETLGTVPQIIGLWWIGASNVMTIVCTGRTRRFMLMLLMVVGVPGLLLAFSSRSLPIGLFNQLQWLYAAAILSLILALVVTCGLASLRRGLVSLQTLVYLALFAAVAFGYCYLFRASVEPIWLPLAIGMIALSILPVLSMPLAISTNRHR